MAKSRNAKVTIRNNSDAPQQSAHIAIAHQGPLPMAAEFGAYERVLPGSADRIIRMAEKSLDAELAEARTRQHLELIALISGRLFVYVLLGVSVFLVLIDKPIAALLAGLAPIISVIYGTFKSGGKRRNRIS